MLEEYLNRGIKDIISEFPPVGDILEQYNIGCVPCAVGSCLLKDIVAIHNLSEEDERALMAAIAGIVDPDHEFELPAISTKGRDRGRREQSYSPPLKKLVEEHRSIKRLLALIPGIVEDLEIESDPGRRRILQTVDFIRQYADKYHHAKEEEILFRYFDENSEILKTMCEEHDEARNHVRAVLDALDRGDANAIADHLNAYRELLVEHIRKEDEILYPWMDRNLSVTQVGELFSKFTDAEEDINKNVIDECKRFVIELAEATPRLNLEVTQ